MTTPLPKLVRDRIPELIEASGRSAVTRTVSEDDLRVALLAKLREETAELTAAPPEDLLEELADVLEVVRSLASVLGIRWSDVIGAADRKLDERGGFDRGLVLVDVAPG